MPEVTPHLGLTIIDPETDGNIYFDVKKHLGDNFLKIDDQFGGAPIPVNVMSGTGIYNAVRDGKLKITGLKGRTLVNLIGRGSETSHYDKDEASSDATWVKESDGFIKVTVSTQYRGVKLKNWGGVAAPGKYYVVIFEHKGDMPFQTQLMGVSHVITPTATPQTFVKRFAGDGVGSWNGVFEKNSAGTYFSIRYPRMYEVTKADYDAMAPMTNEQIAANCPYMDDVKSIGNLFIINSGDNLAPLFLDWSIHANAKLVSERKLELTSTAASQASTTDLFVSPSTTYTLTGKVSGGTTNSGGYLTLGWFNVNGSLIGYESSYYTGNVLATIVSPSNAYKARLYATSDNTNGTYTFEDVMLQLGSVASPYTPPRKTYQFIQTELRSNSDGRQADELFVDENGKLQVLRRNGFMELTGDLDWEFGNDYGGHKYVKCTRPSNVALLADANAAEPSNVMVKYDGKLLYQTYQFSSYGSDAFNITPSTTTIDIDIADVDSGWGDAYTPTKEEIKAYFYGWKMYLGSDPTVPYNGTGTKSWAKIYCGQGTRTAGNTVSGTGTSDFPRIMNDMGYTPYKFQYQLEKPVPESVQTEGEVMLHEGDNHITFGAGVIVRESVVPQKGTAEVSAWYYINTDQSFAPHPNVRLKYRASFIPYVYKNSEIDSGWSHASTFAHGTDRRGYDASAFDVTASYTVTYFALDMHLLGFAPQTCEAEYAANLAELVTQNTYDIVELQTDQDMIRNTYAKKNQSGWITPTLLNSWKNVAGYDPIGYRVDEFGMVHFRGCATGGDVTKPVFILPSKLRPKLTNQYWIGLGNNGTSDVPQTMGVKVDGGVTVGNATRSFLYNSSFLPDA